jgi:hypothetical protein
MKICFINIGRECKSDCMASLSKTEEKPKCLLLETVIARTTPPKNSEKFPVSAPPPEVQ